MKWVLSLVLVCYFNGLGGQDHLNIELLDEYFDALEERQEAMGSIIISKNEHILYHRSFGYRSISENVAIAADEKTNYKIWSITKMYTATMIMQLVEEEALSLDMTLDCFYPTIPNSNIITIKDMLQHKSGIHDFVQNETGDDWDANINEPFTHEFMVKNIAQYAPDFYPSDGFRYSNSNYLLLGYIIEMLDKNLYEISLAKRISSRIGLQSTYFGMNVMDKVDNKAFSFRHTGREWQRFNEGGFSGLIPAGAGGIVSSTKDMVQFMEALFAGRLVSKSTLKQMLPVDNSYGLGLMRTPTVEPNLGFGHTGGYVASESSLYHYPEEGLTIGYATNGIVIRKEEILENVLKIYQNRPFNVSLNRLLLGLIVFGLAVFLTMTYILRFGCRLNAAQGLILGPWIVGLFWITSLVGGWVHGHHDMVSNAITELSEFYSKSGDVTSFLHLIITVVFVPYLISLYQSCKVLKLSFIPIVPLLAFPISLCGSILFPIPHNLHMIFANAILLIIFGPLLVLGFWRKKELSRLRQYAYLSLILMLSSVVLVLSRSTLPEFVHQYWGLIQRLLYLGGTLWILWLSMEFRLRSNRESSRGLHFSKPL